MSPAPRENRLYDAIAESFAELSDEELQSEFDALPPDERAELEAGAERLRRRLLGMLFHHERRRGDNDGARRTLRAMNEAPPGAAKGPA